MVMESPSPQCVGREFVRQYYTVLNKAPLYLHRFYSDNSSFIHGGLDQPGEETEPAVGQQKIHQKIVRLNFCDCHAKIRQVDSLATLDNGIVVQVTGELSNNRQPMRRFMQTFVLVPQSPKNYYVRNDIFRYQDEVFNDDEDTDNQEVVGDAFDQNEQDTPKKIVDTSNYYQQDVMRNGTVHPSDSDLVTPTTPVITDDLRNDSPKDWESAESAETAESEDEEEEEVDEEADSSVIDPVIMQNEPKTYANMVSKNAVGIGFTVSSTSGPASTPPAFGSSINQNKIIETSPVFIKPEANVAPTTVGTSPSTSPGGNSNNYHPGGYSRPRGGLRFNPRRSDSRDSPGGNFNSFANRGGADEPAVDGEKRKPLHYPDSQQLFVGNLPHDIGEDELKEIFAQFGSVIDMRINTKQNLKMGSGGKANVPNFGFIVFDDEEAVQKALSQRPVFYNERHRLNVEEKKTKARETRMGDGRLGSRGGTMGRGFMGNNRGSRGGMPGMNRLDNRGRGMYGRRNW